jgi:hypothetical protein
MHDDNLAVIMARTDAAAGLLLAVLVEKGVVTVSEMSAILDSASNAMGSTVQDGIVASVFIGMREMLNRKHAAVGNPEEVGRTIQ